MPDAFEVQIKQHASSFRYPPTPDIASHLHQRRNPQGSRKFGQVRTAAWAIVLVVLLVAGSLLFAPGVRAQILEFLQFGAIRIFFSESTPTPAASQATLAVTGTSLPLLDDILPERTTLAEARQSAGFEIKLPTGTDSLGNPDAVYVLETASPMVLLVWEPGENPPHDRTSLFIFGPDNFAGKKFIGDAQSARVNGREALWLTEPHAFEFYDNQRRKAVSYFVPDHVLLWWDEEGLTYRLEGRFSLEEALEIANSIR